MKFKLLILILLGLGLSFPPLILAASSHPESSQVDKAISKDDLGKIALGSSVLGVVLIAIPPLSWLGLILGLAGLGLGIFTRKKAKRRIFSRLAIIFGSVAIGYFLVVLGLVLFF